MQIEATVENIIFRNEDNGYTVLEVSADRQVTTAVGIFPSVTLGEKLRLTGEITLHKKYGKQFKVEKIEYIRPETDFEIAEYLGSGIFTGIGKILSERIVEKFGKDTFDIIEKSPERLAEVSKISKTIATRIHDEYMAKICMRDAVMFLQKHDISVSTAVRIFNVYREETVEIVKENPYRLVEDIDGIGFIKADDIASKLGVDKNSEFRVRAGIIHVLKEMEKSGGHTCFPLSDLVDTSATLLGVDPDLVSSTLDILIYTRAVIKKNKMDGDELKPFIALEKNYMLENGIASFLLKMVKLAKPLDIDADKDIALYEKQKGITFHESQKQAIRSAVNSGVVVISGGPGTGKTTIINCIVQILSDNNLNVALGAPTGRAAKRMCDATGKEAKTLHRLLGVHFENGHLTFAYNEYTPLDIDCLIIDEISMADIYIFNSLLRAMPAGSRLVMVGDSDQLPSVSAGNILSDVIKSEIVPVNFLTYVYRQSAKSLIVTNAHRINQGEMPIIDNESEDFYFFETDDKEYELKTIVEMVKERLPRFKNLTPSDIQVLAPQKKGLLGVNNLNCRLQEALNPKNRGILVGETEYRIGDRVMHIRNNYELKWEKDVGYIERGEGVFNGDTGVVLAVDHGSIKVLMDDDRLVTYEREDLGELMLSYAVSVHKSQGSEFPAVIVALSSSAYMLNTKNLLYTAVTRAKKVVVLVGESKTVYKMVKTAYTEKRYTFLVELIKSKKSKIEALQ